MAEVIGRQRRSARRATRVSRELEAARRRNAEQLAEQREREQRVDDALATYFHASDQIVAAREDCGRRIAPHERAIAQLREQLDQLVAEHEMVQGRAALTIHEADRTVEQVGALLGLGEKASRRLIAAGRLAVAGESIAEQGGDTTSDAAAESGQENSGGADRDVRAPGVERHDARADGRPAAATSVSGGGSA